MRANYLLLGVGLISGLTFSQNAVLTGNAKVTVNPNTLVYFGQDFELTSGAQNGSLAVVENSGNIKVDGDYVNASADGLNFLSTWTDNTNYGQVIVNQSGTGGRLAMQKGKISPTTSDWGQFSMPFLYTNANDAMQSLFGTNYVNGANRYLASMMAWDNQSSPEFDHLNSGSTVLPTDYVILNLHAASAGIRGLMSGVGFLTYKGQIANGFHSMGGSLNPNMFFNGINWSVWREYLNNHNEKFKTYIEDPLLPTTDPNYGKYIFQFGNPYTSNLNLGYIGTNNPAVHEDNVYIQNLRGVVKLNTATWALGVGLVATTNVKVSYNSGTNQWAGDAEALIIKPFEPFLVATNNNNTFDFDFNDGLKTFEMAVGTGVVVTPFAGGKMDANSGNNEPNAEEGVNEDAFYQLRLKLYNQDGTETGNRVIVVASSNVQNGNPNSFEAEYFDFGNRTGFYLAQEREDGGHVTSSERKMDINAVNTDFVGKPIPMLLSRLENDTNTYILKAELFQGSIFNRLEGQNQNFDDGNTFFIYDNDLDELVPVTTDLSMEIKPVPVNGAKNRYEVYWNEGPSDKGLGTNDELASSTIIYKDKDSHFVKFNDKWNSAQIKVYDLSGRNIQTFENVNTKNNFEIKLPSRGVYVVKILSNTDEVYVQKIIK